VWTLLHNSFKSTSENKVSPSSEWQQPYKSDAHFRRRRHSRTLLSMNDCVSAMLWQSLFSLSTNEKLWWWYTVCWRALQTAFNLQHSLSTHVAHGWMKTTSVLSYCPCATLRMDCSRSCIRILALTFSCEQLMSKRGHSDVINKKTEITMQTSWPKWCKKMIINSKLVVELWLLFAIWRHYFPKLIHLHYSMMFRMKWLWFVPKDMFNISKSYRPQNKPAWTLCRFRPIAHDDRLYPELYSQHLSTRNYLFSLNVDTAAVIIYSCYCRTDSEDIKRDQHTWYITITSRTLISNLIRSNN